MKKIKELFLMMCETAVIIGQAGLLMLGYERYTKMGGVPCGVAFVLTFLIVYHFNRKKKSEDK